jgi:hypothetical protein
MMLSNLTHSRSTDLSTGRINNIDAALLLMSGGLRTKKELVTVMDAWRPLPGKAPGRGYLFNLTEASRMEGSKRLVGEAWYRRVSKGTYEMTPTGWKRLAEIHGVRVK